MCEAKITGTKWYVDVEVNGNIARFNGEMGLKGFYAVINSFSWVRHIGKSDDSELQNIVKAVRYANKKNKFKIYFINNDGSKYKS